MRDYKNIVANTFTGILVACALFIIAFIIQKELFPSEPQLVIHQIENWQDLELNGWQTGPANAPVQIIEFFDYQCTFCKHVHPAVSAIKQKYGDLVSINYEHFPLTGHAYAFEAAVAAECAGKQDAFTAYHKKLFSNQELLGVISYDSLAMAADIQGLAAFLHCTETQETADVVTSGRRLAEELNINSIPTFIINGSMVTGALPQEKLEWIIQESLSEHK